MQISASDKTEKIVEIIQFSARKTIFSTLLVITSGYRCESDLLLFKIKITTTRPLTLFFQQRFFISIWYQERFTMVHLQPYHSLHSKKC